MIDVIPFLPSHQQSLFVLLFKQHKLHLIILESMISWVSMKDGIIAALKHSGWAGRGKRLDDKDVVAHVDGSASRNLDLKRVLCVKNNRSLFVDLMIDAKYLRITRFAVRPQHEGFLKSSRYHLIWK